MFYIYKKLLTMKKIILLTAMFLGLQFSYAAFPLSVEGSKDNVTAQQLKQQQQLQQRMLMEKFVKMSVKDYETLTGKKLTLLQKAGFKVKQKIMARELRRDAENTTSTNTLLLVILAIILPPLAVYLHENAFNGKFWLDLVLTLLFYVPGLVYALIVVLAKK